MKQRCLNPKAQHYIDYGGRGIKVYHGWIESFDDFLDDVGYRPNKSYSLDRINNDGNYEPGNVRWIDKTVQSINSRLKSTSTSGVRGVNWYASKQRWHVRIRMYGKTISLGYYKDKSEAIRVRKEAEAKYYQPLLASS
jgi:hypothetical protein